MKRILLNSLAGVSLLGFSLTAAAQDQTPKDPDAYHTDRADRFRDQHWHIHLFDEVRKDLQHVQNVTWPGGRDTYRLTKTLDELNDLQGKLESHVYDQQDLDDVIGVLSRVVNDNHMEYRDRDMLKEDLMTLQQYRKHHEDWDR